MKCAECNCWVDGACIADPNWPAPCEYEDEDTEDDPSCSTCYNADQDTTDDVACCNCCEDGSFFEEYKDEYTLADLGQNWW